MFQDKCAIVTGSSRGIGKSIVLDLAAKGCNVVINYRSSKEEAEVLLEQVLSMGVKAIIVKADVSKFEEAEFLVKEAMNAFGKIDILVNNAGITKDTLLLRMKKEDFESVIDTNLKSCFNCIKHVTPVMLKQKSGRIINMSSVVGLTGNAGQINYAASKAGVIGMTKSLAKEVGSKGITVNAVAPGFIKTDMTDKLSDKQKELILGSIPAGRLGEPEDIAAVVTFLSGNGASYITGQVISVNGGMAMQ